MKKTVKVKQSVRKGKVVKAHTRTIDVGKLKNDLEWHLKYEPRFYGPDLDRWTAKKKRLEAKLRKATGQGRKTAFEKFQDGSSRNLKGVFEGA